MDMDDNEFKLEDLHLDLRPKRRRFRNSSKTKVYVFTWNTNGRNAPDDLDKAFSPGADIYAIGLQEVGSFDWTAAFDKIIKPFDVVRIKVRQLQGILTLVYIRRELLHHIGHIESETTKTGLGGMWGNKGSSSIRFDLLGVNLIVVNSHLAAHVEKVMERVEGITSTLESQNFRDNDVENILDHDYVIWMGDLNFRLDDVSYETALECIEQKDYASLLKKDQLTTVMKDEMVFLGFSEDNITFPPTFKFDVGTDTYDTSAKMRVPAYCDRILYFHHDITYGKKDSLCMKSQDYQSHPMFKSSDHKPVSLSLEIYGLQNPPPAMVVFHKEKKAATLKTPFVVKFSFKTAVKSTHGDWVGLYQTDFMHFKDYVSFQWVPTKQGMVRQSAVTFPTGTFKKIAQSTEFVTCYISKQNHFCGISHPYELVH